MNELATIPRISDLPARVINQFTKTELMYISLTEAEKFSQIEENRLPGMLLPVIEYTYRTLGHGYDGKLAAIMAADLSIILRKYHSQSTMEELREAVSKGTIGKYGETKTAVSAAMIERWLVRYKDEISLEKKLALKKLKDLTEVKTIPTQSMEDAELDFCYNHWLTTHDIVDMNNFVYDSLVMKGNIKVSDERFKEFADIVFLIMTSSLKKKIAKPCINRQEYAEKKKANETLEGLTSESPAVIRATKNMILGQFFKKVKTKLSQPGQ